MSYNDQGPDYVQAWFKLEWALLLFKIFIFGFAILGVAIMFVLTTLFPDYGAQIILWFFGILIIGIILLGIWAIARKRPAPYNPATDMETSNYRWDPRANGPFREPPPMRWAEDGWSNREGYVHPRTGEEIQTYPVPRNAPRRERIEPTFRRN